MNNSVMSFIKGLGRRVIPAGHRESVKRFAIKVLRFTKQDLDYFYDDSFVRGDLSGKAWAEDFCALVMKMFEPKSIVDFGCGTGDVLAAFENKGLVVLGIDGSKACRRHSRLSDKNFLLFDIRNKYSSDTKYDLCFCLEVAEHIEERYSDILVENLTLSSPVVLFSAAPPGQGGSDHCNLKPYGYWIEKFNKHGFELDRQKTEDLKAEMRNMRGVQEYYIDNLHVFFKK